MKAREFLISKGHNPDWIFRQLESEIDVEELMEEYAQHSAQERYDKAKLFAEKNGMGKYFQGIWARVAEIASGLTKTNE